ncbi:MAG: helicase-related protein [Methylobacter sp.]|nr:helicase-related protein [Methylobacter sp.]
MLLDNKKNGIVGDTLRDNLQTGSSLSIISGLFSIYGFDALKKELNRVDQVRLLFSKVESVPGDSLHLQGLNGDQFERRFKNQLNQHQIAKECADWLTKKAEIKRVNNPNILNQNLFHIQKGHRDAIAIQGSSNFTTSGLGFSESDKYDMNMCLTEPDSTEALLEWFNAIWNDPSTVEDIKQLILNELNQLIENQSPAFIYFLTLFNVFKDFIEELDEERIIKTKTGFKQTLVWKKLYKFQRDGVLGAIDKLEKYNGCIIADSVGLGKTFEALAVIKYYELRNDRVLVLSPKKLRENWTIYTVNDKRNILSADRFNYDVLNHTDLTRTSGKSGEINLETLNWGNYDLIVIDESHNFRNNNLRKEGATRYSRLMNDVIKTGVKTKVLMLSATPVNSRMNDLKNQVSFIAEGIDDAFSEHGIASIEQTLKKAQTRFNQWLDLDDKERKVEILLERMNFDYFKLLDLLTIARSRKHIEKYYDIAEIGAFPERLKPLNIKADIDGDGDFPPLKDINQSIRRLHLSAYAPLKYVRMEKREEYSRKYDMKVGNGSSVFKQVDREQSLIHLIRVNLLKRMESSINSFALTLGKLLKEVDFLIQKIDTHDDGDIEEFNIEDIEIEDQDFESYLIGRKVKVLIKDIDAVRWKQDLEEDRQRLATMLNEARLIEPQRDAKLQLLKDIISHKCQNPVNLGNKKLIIFTAFADTANYLYGNLADWAQTELKLHSALVTGTGTNKTTLSGINRDLNSILTTFSPVSKERHKIDVTATHEIDLLIATDCISEGQNLQDCDYLINYDIHWNPVRIIQRFGRIDRLGSKNAFIQLINFWPNMELDEYINLEARVSGRMVLLDISATGEENIIEYDDKKRMNDLEYRRKQLQQLQNDVVNLEDMAGGVSITDLTLNDFKMDLSAFMKERMANLASAPTGLFAVTAHQNSFNNDSEPGVIFCLKNISGKTAHDNSYALAPYYLIYVTKTGTVKYNFLQAKKILDILKKQGLSWQHPDPKAVDLFLQDTEQGKDMSQYRTLLETAINSIIGKAEEKGVESLFSRGGTVLSKNNFKGSEDFEVISYMIITEAA